MATKTIRLQPFTVPNYVLVDMPKGVRQDGFKEAPKFHLSDLDEDTLNELCDEFRTAVMKKAKAKTQE